MSNEKPTTVKLKVFKPDSVIKIDISHEFYGRIQKLLFWHAGKDHEKALKAIEALKSRDPQDDFETHICTILALIYEIESKASEQNCLEEKNFKVPNE